QGVAPAPGLRARCTWRSTSLAYRPGHPVREREQRPCRARGAARAPPARRAKDRASMARDGRQDDDALALVLVPCGPIGVRTERVARGRWESAQALCYTARMRVLLVGCLASLCAASPLLAAAPAAGPATVLTAGLDGPEGLAFAKDG